MLKKALILSTILSIGSGPCSIATVKFIDNNECNQKECSNFCNEVGLELISCEFPHCIAVCGPPVYLNESQNDLPSEKKKDSESDVSL